MIAFKGHETIHGSNSNLVIMQLTEHMSHMVLGGRVLGGGGCSAGIVTTLVLDSGVALGPRRLAFSEKDKFTE